MSRRRERRLSDEDRILWSKVARTVMPLSGVAPPAEEHATLQPADPEPAATPGRSRLPPPQHQPPATQAPRSPDAIDARTRGRIAKGRLSIDGRIDLHGLTQARAHGLLLSFLSRAQGAGLRHVLVITGKGSSPSSEGVLRRAVPGWLSTPPFAGLVSGYSAASRQHGGDGALYVRLRRGGGRAA